MRHLTGLGCSLSDQRYRVLAIGSHPVQYMAPLFRRMAKHPQFDLQVAYCTLRGAQAAHDPEFGTTVQWDVPLLDGYPWREVPNHGFGKESFFGLFNPGLWRGIREGKFDAVLCYTGYMKASFWISYFASRSSGTPFLFGTDASSIAPRDARAWKVPIKKALWPLLFSLADQVIVPSTPAKELMMSLRIAEERVTLTPYSVDNDWWMEQSSHVNREEVREQWGATRDTRVILFCAKLQPWKRPLDLLRAFSKAHIPGALLLYAGEGLLRPQLEQEAAALGITEQVRFLGFVNQSQLPGVYTAADLMVLPSDYEPFAVVVNEASCCGCPVSASDRVGAARDLIAPVNPELMFPCGNVDALAAVLRKALADPARLIEMARAARRRMEEWTPERNIDATIDAVRSAVERRNMRRRTQP